MTSTENKPQKIHPLLAEQASWERQASGVRVLHVAAKAFVPSTEVFSDYEEFSNSGSSHADVYINIARFLGRIGQLSGLAVPLTVVFGAPEMLGPAAITFLSFKALSLGSEVAEKHIAQQNGFVPDANPGHALVGP